MSLTGFLDRVADVATFDKAIDPARRAVQAVLRPPALKDFLHGTWLGHPLHPVLVQVPVGSWISAGVLDAVPALRPAATALIGTGVVAAVPAALSGAADWSEQEAGVRRLGALHALLNTAALGCYVGSLVARSRGRGALGRVLSYTGLGLATSSASIGGHPAGEARGPDGRRPRDGPRARTAPGVAAARTQAGPASPGGTGRRAGD